VAGGLQKALNVPWKEEATKIVLMVADAPAHGKEYHAVGMKDSYSEGDPTGLVPVDQIKEMARRGFDFYFIKCNTSTDDMLRLFATAFEDGRANENQAFCVLDLTPQGGSHATSTASISAPMGSAARTRDAPAPHGIPSASGGGMRGPPMAFSAASISPSMPAAPSRAMESAAAPSSTADDFMRALTSSVKSSVASRSRAK
jgi:hypothetical protein